MYHGQEELSVHVSTGELIETLKKNKETHRKVFEEAMEGYRVKAIETLRSNLALIEQGKHIRVSITMQVPEDHTTDYERVIRMLEMHVNDYIDLTQSDFAQYVMDDWGWRASWLDTANFYGSVTAASISNSQ